MAIQRRVPSARLSLLVMSLFVIGQLLRPCLCENDYGNFYEDFEEYVNNNNNNNNNDNDSSDDDSSDDGDSHLLSDIFEDTTESTSPVPEKSKYSVKSFLRPASSHDPPRKLRVVEVDCPEGSRQCGTRCCRLSRALPRREHNCAPWEVFLGPYGCVSRY